MSKGITGIKWHKCDLPKEDLKQLMERSNIRGLVHTLLFLILLAVLGYGAWLSIGTIWMLPAFFLYGTVYCFFNHLMHETIHRTPFKSRKLNDFIHWWAAFFNGVEAVSNRWRHLRHHKVTYFEKLDPEVEIFRPASISKLLKRIFINIPNPFPVLSTALGKIDEVDREQIPKKEWRWLIWSSRLWLLGYGLIIASCIILSTWLPLVYTAFARFYGAPFARLLDLSQHVGLETYAPDHRLCCRTIYLNPLSRFLYWDMNYHIEHHMFPAVPFHSLEKLHRTIKDQLPPTYPSLLAAYREIIPTVIRQSKEPEYHITPTLPTNQRMGSPD